MFVLVLTASAAVDANVRRKLTVLEKRIGLVEFRMNNDNEQANEMFTTLQQNYEELNDSVHHLKDQKCPQSMNGEEKGDGTNMYKKDIIEMQTQSQMLVSLGIESEKKWTRDQVGKLTNQLSENTDLLKRQCSDLSNQIHLQNDQVTKNYSRLKDMNDAIVKKNEQMEDQMNLNLKRIETQQKEIETLKDILAKINSTLYSTTPTTTHVQTTTPKTTTFICPMGWIRFSAYCYLLVNEKKNFYEARANCESVGASLADFTSQTENSFVAEKLQIGSNTWIGYSDEETEGTWVSLRTGQSARFTYVLI
ncbi:C-type lectin domain family 4 member F-like [Ruditapes philippinarum]|uniref:C-type lectin domain family 4 member F-like n=1 Tax=Ruditapes philippinarum TaxID=129788 RepID=UPI00295B8A3D|nr:C-type lectin domain family 4 member F-like [Ruditapes philippinarum]